MTGTRASSPPSGLYHSAPLRLSAEARLCGSNKEHQVSETEISTRWSLVHAPHPSWRKGPIHPVVSHSGVQTIRASTISRAFDPNTRKRKDNPLALSQAVMRVTSTKISLASVGPMGPLAHRAGQEVQSYPGPRKGENWNHLPKGTNN